MSKAWACALLMLTGYGVFRWGYDRGQQRAFDGCSSVETNLGGDGVITYICEPHGKPKPELPKGQECMPGVNESMSDFIAQYKCSAEGKWVMDVAAMEAQRKHWQDRDDLYWALRTRVLTDKELAKVRAAGPSLVEGDGASTSKTYAERFASALAIQFQMRVLAKECSNANIITPGSLRLGAPKKEKAPNLTPVPLPIDKEWDFNVMGPTANITFTPGGVEPYEVYPVEAQDCRIPEGAVGPLDPCVRIRLWLKKGTSTLPNGILTMSGVPCVGSLCNKTPSYMALPHGGHHK